MTSKNLWETLLVVFATAVITLIFLFGVTNSRVPAATPNDILAQVRSASQLSDVQPSDYYFQSLQSLVDKYGVNVAYPDGTFRPNRAMTRGEFAIFLNTALDRLVNKEITAKTADLGTKEELAILQKQAEKLQEEIESLRQYRRRVSPNNRL